MKNNIYAEYGLLIFRVLLSLMLYINHGHEKLFHFDQMLAKIPDPLHIGKMPGLLLATFTDVLCSFFLLVGFRTKAAAVMVAFNTLAAFILVQHMEITSLRGEIAALYFCGAMLLAFAGPGLFSIDRFRERRRAEAAIYN